MFLPHTHTHTTDTADHTRSPDIPFASFVKLAFNMPVTMPTCNLSAFELACCLVVRSEKFYAKTFFICQSVATLLVILLPLFVTNAASHGLGGAPFFLSTKAKSGGSLCLFVELLANGASRMDRISARPSFPHLLHCPSKTQHLARIAAPYLLLIVFRSFPSLNTGQQIVMETPASRDPGAGALVTRSASSSATAALFLSRFVSKVNCSQGGSVS